MNNKKPVPKGGNGSDVRSKFIGILIVTVLSVMVVVPGMINSGIRGINGATNIGLPTLPENKFNLGLDLQGGAHLVYNANVNEIPEKDRVEAVEGLRDVIENRVRGGLGVSEPLVQTTRVGDEYRIIVELPGVTNIEDAIAKIGDTPRLEFKEVNNDPPRALTAEEKKQLEAFNAAALKKANEALAVMKKGMKFEDAVAKYSEDEATKSKNGEIGFISRSVSAELYDWAKTHKDGDVSKELVKNVGGYNIIKRLGQRDGEKQVSVSHLLICYAGAQSCDNSSLTKEEAKAKIEELKKQATPQNFAELARKNSTEPGAPERAGEMLPFTMNDRVSESFKNAAFEAKVGTIAGPVETEFGYHLIYKKGEETPKEYNIARLLVRTKDQTDIVPPQDMWKATKLTGKNLKRAEVSQDRQTGKILVNLQFDEEGEKLFADITTRNVGKQVAIFLDGEPVTTPVVDEPIVSGGAVISGRYTFAEARDVVRRLNSGALPVPVELIGREQVDATLGVASLEKSFHAGLVGLLVVMVFMVAYYRLPGLLSAISLGVYAILNLAIFKIIGVTLTLAGIAGFILSIGMAVDTNVLVFERLKEELRRGRSLRAALEEAFVRSWPSIRDGHVTTLISCLFLIWFGAGFIEGFALILAVGTLISLFTAITVTRTVMRVVVGRFKEQGGWMFVGSTKKNDSEVTTS